MTTSGMSAISASCFCSLPELPAVHDRHHQVQQDHARARVGGLEVVERLASVADARDLVALVLQHLAQRIANVRIVVDHQDAAARPRGPHGRDHSECRLALVKRFAAPQHDPRMRTLSTVTAAALALHAAAAGARDLRPPSPAAALDSAALIATELPGRARTHLPVGRRLERQAGPLPAAPPERGRCRRRSCSTAAAGSPGARTRSPSTCCPTWRWGSRSSTSTIAWRAWRRRRPPSRTAAARCAGWSATRRSTASIRRGWCWWAARRARTSR